MRGARRERKGRKDEVERWLLARGLSLDDINYYAVAGHEYEAYEAYGEEVAEAIVEQAEVMRNHEEYSACKLSGRL